MNTSQVVPFCFNDYLIRTIAIEDAPWFVAKDVCGVLGYGNPRQALATHLDDDEKGVQEMDTPGGKQEVSIISESGLYTLIIRSNKPQAKPFRRWVTKEVLPAIRKTGLYQMAEDGDRSVEVKHTHLRGTTPPGSLDIRYTLDLSKIILHPTRRSVAMLERITGIDLADIISEHQVGDRTTSNFNDFLSSAYTRDIDKAVPFAAVYRDYLAWCKGLGCRAFEVASRRSFGDLVRRAGFGVKVSGGTCRIYDIRKSEEVTR